MLVKKRGIRILSLLLSVLLTVGVFSVVPIEVGAAETDSAPVGVNNYHYHFDLQMLGIR